MECSDGIRLGMGGRTANVGSKSVRWAQEATDALRTHLAAGHRALQQVNIQWTRKQRSAIAIDWFLRRTVRTDSRKTGQTPRGATPSFVWTLVVMTYQLNEKKTITVTDMMTI